MPQKLNMIIYLFDQIKNSLYFKLLSGISKKSNMNFFYIIKSNQKFISLKSNLLVSKDHKLQRNI